jgi:hypothetical protein
MQKYKTDSITVGIYASKMQQRHEASSQYIFGEHA